MLKHRTSLQIQLLELLLCVNFIKI